MKRKWSIKWICETIFAEFRSKVTNEDTKNIEDTEEVDVVNK